MAVPALMYLAAVGNDEQLRNGWAIPAATDIAFAIGVLAILGRRVPASIKLLLVTIAIVDDIGAVIIIALFYTADLNVPALAAALAIAGGMAALGQFGVRRLWPFMAGFVLLWLMMLASGIHATIAGVLAALNVPLGRGEESSPLKRLEHRVHPWVMFGVVPLSGSAPLASSCPAAWVLFCSRYRLPSSLGFSWGNRSESSGPFWLAERLKIAARPKVPAGAKYMARRCSVGSGSP
jgi:NhaA family Na+:H+ antiporter